MSKVETLRAMIRGAYSRELDRLERRIERASLAPSEREELAAEIARRREYLASPEYQAALLRAI